MYLSNAYLAEVYRGFPEQVVFASGPRRKEPHSHGAPTEGHRHVVPLHGLPQHHLNKRDSARQGAC